MVYDSPEAKNIPEQYRHEGEHYTVVNILVTALMVNTSVVDGGEAPKTWKDLTGPEWKGKIITADPADSTTAFTALYGAHKVLGDADFKKLVDNLVVTDNSATTYTSVAQGEYAATLGYESNVYPFIEGGQPGIELVYPEDGTFIMEDAAAIVEKASDPENAKRFFDAILTKESQEQMLEVSYRRPVREDIDVSKIVDLPNTSDLNIVPIDESAEEAETTAFLELWDSLK